MGPAVSWNLKIWVTYALTEAGDLELPIGVETDQDTLGQPDHHSYFNLSGNFTQAINDHVFQINHQRALLSILTVSLFRPWIETIVRHLYQAMLLEDPLRIQIRKSAW